MVDDRGKDEQVYRFPKSGDVQQCFFCFSLSGLFVMAVGYIKDSTESLSRHPKTKNVE